MALGNKRNHRCRVNEHDVVDLTGGAFAGPLRDNVM